jgi:hypothetical protein
MPLLGAHNGCFLRRAQLPIPCQTACARERERKGRRQCRYSPKGEGEGGEEDGEGVGRGVGEGLRGGDSWSGVERERESGRARVREETWS